jgi:hypothetical protein
MTSSSPSPNGDEPLKIFANPEVSLLVVNVHCWLCKFLFSNSRTSGIFELSNFGIGNAAVPQLTPNVSNDFAKTFS